MLVVFFIILLALLLVLPVWWWRGAPFLPTDPRKISRIIRLAGIQPGEQVVDLGSGDGRLVIACARAGANVIGLELNPFLVWLSRLLVRQARVQERAMVRRVNFWHQDLSNFSLVLVFGVGGRMMQELEAKLQQELKVGSRVVSNGFQLPTWPLAARDGSLYLYRKK